jgi:hypothetical protein
LSRRNQGQRERHARSHDDVAECFHMSFFLFAFRPSEDFL